MNCRFTGMHRYKLEVSEVCSCCGSRKRGKIISRFGVILVPIALWTIVALLAVLVIA